MSDSAFVNRALIEQPFRLIRIGLERCRLRMSRPLVTGSATYRERQVTIVRVQLGLDGRRAHGVGEASPLSEWTSRSGHDPASAARRIEPDLELPGVLRLDERLPWLERFPVLRFGLECGILDALARDRGLPLHRLLDRGSLSHLDSVPVQFTLGALDLRASLDSLRRAVAQGFSHAKLKVGVDAPDDELAKVLRLAEACPELTLRLDANGAWNTETALRMLRSLPPERVELVEQPVADAELADLLGAYDGNGPLVAADESCADRRRVRALIRSGRLGAVVVKPSVVGGLLPACELFTLARRHDVRVVVSNLMESAVGRASIAQLAAAWPELPGPHGLATGDWFAEDLAPDSDAIAGGRLALRAGPGFGFEPTAGP